jgi:hypothetical protein
MLYKRKSDGFTINISPMDFFMGICHVPYSKLISEWEEIKEEKIMYHHSIDARCVNCGLRQPYSPAAEAPTCKNNGCNGILSTCENMFDKEKPMHNFKAGDKVAIYGTIGYSGISSGELVCDGFQSTIKSVDGNYFIVIHNDRPSLWSRVHYKQCRKLKKKREPGRIWIKNEMCEMKSLTQFAITVTASQVKPLSGEWTEFVEVRKK